MLWTLQQSSNNLLNYWCHISCILPAPSSCPLACGLSYFLVLDSLPGFWEFLPLTHWLFSSCLSQLAHSILVLPPGTHTSAQTLPSKHVDSFQGWVIETKEQSLQLAPAKVSVSLFFSFLKKYLLQSMQTLIVKHISPFCTKVYKHLRWHMGPCVSSPRCDETQSSIRARWWRAFHSAGGSVAILWNRCMKAPVNRRPCEVKLGLLRPTALTRDYWVQMRLCLFSTFHVHLVDFRTY